MLLYPIVPNGPFYPLYYICVFYHRNTEADFITAVQIQTLV